MVKWNLKDYSLHTGRKGPISLTDIITYYLTLLIISYIAYFILFLHSTSVFYPRFMWRGPQFTVMQLKEMNKLCQKLMSQVHGYGIYVGFILPFARIPKVVSLRCK